MGMNVFDRYLAFRFKDGHLQPIENPHMPKMEDLLHIERQKQTLLRNTELFVKKRSANDVLLWGERGTGKSSLVKAMLSVFYDQGLRIIQVYKMDILHLSELYTLLRREDKSFVLFFDDLSFKEDEESFRLLKSFMDGDIEERPPNVVVYATSNRRNLVPQSAKDEKFPEDGAQEIYSLVDRFGLKIGFFGFKKEEFLNIVRNYLEKYSIKMDEELIFSKAIEWASERGFSGRSAFQFVKWVLLST